METDGSTMRHDMTKDRTAFAQRSQEKLYFDHKDMDYYLSWIVGRQIYDGSDPTKCFDVTVRIEDGDAQSWQREWRIKERARMALASGDLARARVAYLQACTYYRAPLFIMKPQAADFPDGWRKMQFCFRKAAVLFAPPIEHIEVPFQGELLPGYFWKVDESGEQRPTLIVIGGIEAFAEGCYFMTGRIGLQRGYNVMTVDLPGQGPNPDRGLFFEARMESPMEAVVDYAVQHPEIDARRLALFGFSWGGHIVFKGGQHDRRIKALIANPPMPSVFRAFLAQQKSHDRSDPIARIVFEQIAWRMGLRISLDLRDIARRVAKAYDYLVHGWAAPHKILCPTLCLAGEGEAPITLKIAGECLEQLPHPMKRLRIFTKEEGGEAHSQVNNLALPNRVMFDWLDEVFS